MPKQKASFWSEFKVVFDINGKEKYKCKTCSSTWVKNASRLKEHIEQCKGIDAETGYTRAQGTKRKKQQKLDEYNYIFTSKDQIVLESLLIRALFSAACPSFKIPSRYILSNTLLNQEFEHLQLIVKSTLSESSTYCLITD
ncbi:14467_t:CDS:2 [Funneliformis geosporum]|uniref:14467_t:CDS:1 n=1 Tax=Funneliformis geosporum TaxID=1117311 RepID=A0A9W4SLX9_9GLOM|nr:14467_t:CDS:2 [Funneliformis geosporum]